jgi:hypothetical protein
MCSYVHTCIQVYIYIYMYMNSYIQVTDERISIIASDVTGLLYSLYALTQLLTLHSELNVYKKGTYVYILI